MLDGELVELAIAGLRLLGVVCPHHGRTLSMPRAMSVSDSGQYILNRHFQSSTGAALKILGISGL